MSTVTVSGGVSVVTVTLAAVPVGGATVHADLTLRSAADSHPISAITGLQAQLTALAADIALCSTDADLAVVVGNLATVTADLAAHLASSTAHTLSGIAQSSATTGQVPVWNGTAWAAATPSGLPAGGVLNRSLRKLSSTDGDADWTGYAIKRTVSVDGQSCSELDVSEFSLPEYVTRQALTVKFSRAGTPYYLRLGGTYNETGNMPLITLTSNASASYNDPGVYLAGSGFGLNFNNQSSGIWIGTNATTNTFVSAYPYGGPYECGGNCYLQITKSVSRPSAVPTSAYGVISMENDRVIVKLPNGDLKKFTLEAP